MGERLTGDLVKAFARTLDLPASRTVIGLDPAVYEIVARGGEGDKLLHARVDGRGGGPRALAAGEADIWMSARQVTKAEADEAAKQASGGHPPALDQLVSRAWEHEVALDTIVLMVSPRNAVKALSLPQLRDIFTGKVRTWSAGGGAELPITIVTPPSGASEFDSFCETVMGLTDPAECEKAIEPARRQIASAADLSDDVAASAGAIGLGSAAFLRGNRALSITTECGTATPSNLDPGKGEEYPLVRRLYYYAPPSHGTEAADFLAYATSDAARPVIEAAGYTPLHAGVGGDGYAAARLEGAGDARDGGHTRIRPADVGAFEEATLGATRLPIVLHFQPGSNELDTQARADLQRLAALMHTAPDNKAELVLIGYSQALGDYATNHEISQRRVDAVKTALATNFSVKAAVAVGVGPAAPVACNLEPTGRFLNQRVEAWLRTPK